MQGASLYAHVTSKEDVLWAIVDRASAAFETAADAVDIALPDGGPAERLAALARAHVGVIAADVGEASVFIHEWRSLSPDRRAQIAARRDAYERRVRGLIEAGMAAGVFGPTDPAVAALFILTALNGIATWYRPDGRLAPDRIADHYADLTIRAVAGESR